MTKTIYKLSALLAILAVILPGCRKEDFIIPEEVDRIPVQNAAQLKGFYLLNEGNMNMNKASLDFIDFEEGLYRRNIFGQANPNAVLGLGDVGSDIGVYGSKLYAVINNSNKIEVMDMRTAQRIGVIDVKNVRYITFANGRAYVSAYGGEVQLGGSSPNGFIAEIDTATLQITRTVEAGRQPEELATIGNQLFVANSGGYDPVNYETTVSVIDLTTFTETKRIEVAPNLHRLRATDYGDLYVSSRGDHFTIPSRLFVIDTQTHSIKHTFDIACTNLAISGDTAYIIGAEFSYLTNKWEVNYSMINVRTHTLLTGSFLPQSIIDIIQIPYGIAIDPYSGFIYITDARDYVSPGILYCVDPNGSVMFSIRTGDIPAHFAFVYK
ncbi:MAG: YncE family protein [Dysgonamonadaceae bacterium]|jgi:DNA-binding beta-propeller fold protein YncE|nr:YncE family protein [Dysgonamonadaceae bacterium]